MSAKNNGQRIFILVIVGAFALSSFSLTGFVIYDMIKGKDKKPPVSAIADAQKQFEEQLKKQQDAIKKEDTLEGTKLANFTPVDKVDALQKIDVIEGTGEVVQPGAKVTAHYTGALAKDGTIFQSSHDMGQPVPFSLDGVIKGWTDGVPGMKVGGTRRLVIPADQAYAGAERPGIPANSDLVFDIELVKIGE